MAAYVFDGSLLGKLPRKDALRRAGLMMCTYGQPYDQCVEST